MCCWTFYWIIGILSNSKRDILAFNFLRSSIGSWSRFKIEMFYVFPSYFLELFPLSEGGESWLLARPLLCVLYWCWFVKTELESPSNIFSEKWPMLGGDRIWSSISLSFLESYVSFSSKVDSIPSVISCKIFDKPSTLRPSLGGVDMFWNCFLKYGLKLSLLEVPSTEFFSRSMNLLVTLLRTFWMLSKSNGDWYFFLAGDFHTDSGFLLEVET